MVFREKRLVLAIALIGIVSLTAAGIAERKALVFWWWRWRAVRECRAPKFNPDSAAWTAILKSGEDGYPTIAKLLRDPDPKIGEITWPMIDERCSSRESFLEYAQTSDPSAAVRYLFPIPPLGQQPWRTPPSLVLCDSEWYRYWCGEGRDHLSPTKEAIDYLESMIVLGQSPERAMGGLAAFLKPGEASNPGSPLASRVVELLARIGREEPSLEALRLLAMRATEPVADRPRYRIPFHSDWTLYSKGDPLNHSMADFVSREAILSLCHLDQPWTLGVITRLLRNPEIQPALAAILAESPRLGSLEMPVWQPPVEAARRFFSRGPTECAAAASFLAEEGLREGIPIIREALAREPEPGLAFHYRSCLVALGDESQR